MLIGVHGITISNAKLTGGSSGTLEVLTQCGWQNLFFWGSYASKVLCRQLGYSSYSCTCTSNLLCQILTCDQIWILLVAIYIKLILDNVLLLEQLNYAVHLAIKLGFILILFSNQCASKYTYVYTLLWCTSYIHKLSMHGYIIIQLLRYIDYDHTSCTYIVYSRNRQG